MNKRACKAALCVLLTLSLLFITACGDKNGFTAGGEPAVSNPDFVRTPPPVRMPEYVGTNQQANEDDKGRSGAVDLTNVNEGYISAKVNAPTEARIRIAKDGGGPGDIDDYPLANNGTVNFFPITRGDGAYTITLFLFLEDSPQGPLFEQFIVANTQVTLQDEFVPFTIPNVIISYTPESQSVQLSHELTAHAATDLEVVQLIYDWISKNITYDTEKADRLTSSVGTIYVPDPDETLSTKKGICYDYASLAAAMLRANGIPTKLVKGDVRTPDGDTVYHAWNLIWVEGTGWIAVELPNSPGEWTRIDLTFAASGGKSIAKFIGDGENYTLISVH